MSFEAFLGYGIKKPGPYPNKVRLYLLAQYRVTTQVVIEIDCDLTLKIKSYGYILRHSVFRITGGDLLFSMIPLERLSQK